MKISVFSNNLDHPIYPTLRKWVKKVSKRHRVQLVSTKNKLVPGDLLFLICCSEIIRMDVRKNYRYTLVVHASDLPMGRGWSPQNWQVVEGKNKIPVSLF